MRYPGLILLLLVFDLAVAYETDQYLNRTQAVEDSLGVMDREVNNAIQSVLNRKHPPRTEREVAAGIYWEIGGIYWADKIERWAARSDEVHKYEQTRHQSIYRGMPIWATRVNFIFGIGRSFRVNNVMVGSDKFGHFISQGFKYYKRQARGESTSRILAKGRFAERWLFGQLTTGVYSNADLVANYEGWLFYQSLFKDGIVPGKQAIVVKRGDRFEQQRPFTWADHINDYWDEALNPSFLVDSLNGRLRERIIGLCSHYDAAPEFYSVNDDAGLWQRYASLGLKDNRANQFESICTE